MVVRGNEDRCLGRFKGLQLFLIHGYKHSMNFPFFRLVLLPLRTFLRILRDIDGFFTWVSRLVLKPKYEIVGKCLKRGLCCHNIGVYLVDGIWKRPALKRWVVGWYEFVYNFEFKGENQDARVLVFKCKYLVNNACSIYFKRPYICRQFPSPPRFFLAPQMLPGCGYGFRERVK